MEMKRWEPPPHIVYTEEDAPSALEHAKFVLEASLGVTYEKNPKT